MILEVHGDRRSDSPQLGAGRQHPEGPAIALLIAARHPRIIRENVENVESAA